MKRFLITTAALLLPATAFALNFTDVSNRYVDAPFDQPTTAGVSVLTNLGAVAGNPDGTFAPTRSVNRAEFLKILFLSDASVTVSASDVSDCFPDVYATDWFSRYVCLAKVRGTVGGYPDGTFKPGQTVNYAEALKMLSSEFGIKGANPTDPWYLQYATPALAAGVTLPDGTAYDTPLTRGQVARLVAAYRAYHDGVLPQYRAFEQGQTISMSSASSASSTLSSVSSSSSQSSSSSSSVSSSSSSSSAPSLNLFPATSHFLLTGRTSAVVADGTFTSVNEDAVIRFVDFTLRQQVRSIDHFVLVDAAGTPIVSLTPSTNDNTDNLKWHGEVSSAASTYVLSKGIGTQLGLEAVLKNVGAGGVPNELFDTQDFSMVVQGVTTGASSHLVPTQTHYPLHQTASAHITAVRNAGSGSAMLKAGNAKLIGLIAIGGESMTGGSIQLSSISFTIQTTGVNVGNIRIGGAAAIQQSGCSADTSQPGVTTCNTIPSMFQSVGASPTIIGIYADVSLKPGIINGSLQLTFSGRGAIGQAGAILWSDNVGHYTWVESAVPLDGGTAWTVSQ